MAQGLSEVKTRVLILGATGMIGHQVYNHLKMTGSFDLHSFSFRERLVPDTVIIDARDEHHLIAKIAKIAPDYIVNCIGILISGSANNPENAIFLNAYLPHRLKNFADQNNCRLIHISTDCVFSGQKKGPYNESDPKDGVDVYAKSKGMGEVVSSNHLTLRTSVIGPELKSNGEELFHWFMNQTGTIKGFTKSIWSGVTTIELARAVESAITRQITGLHHVTNNSPITKYDLLRLIKKHTHRDIKIEKVDGRETDKSFRDNRGELGLVVPSYEKMITEMVSFVEDHRELYSHYFDKC